MALYSLTRFRLAALLLLVAGPIACAPSPANWRPLPMAPTSPTVAPQSSRTSSTHAAGVSSATRAGGSYDATGVWRLVVADQRNAEIYEDVETELTQHLDGTITFCGECEGEQFTLTPRGAGQGAAAPYALSYFGDGEPCDGTLSGSAVLDTRTGTIRAHGVQGMNDDCSRLLVSIVLTRRQ